MTKCPLSGTWPVRGGSVLTNGTCTCGKRVMVRMDGKLPTHNKPMKRKTK